MGRPADPRIPGSSPSFAHIDEDDPPWVEVKRQRNADGTVSCVREKWLAFSADPPYLSLYARYDPGMIVREHGHNSPHVLFVLDGEITIGDRACTAGSHVELPYGATFGPLVAGPGGCTLFEVMTGDPRSWGVDAESFRRACDEQGVEPLPDPPIEMPERFSDMRAFWADGERRRDSAPDP